MENNHGSIAKMLCDVCGQYWDYDIAEITIDEFAFGTGVMTCQACELGEAKMIALEWFKNYENELSKVLWMLTRMDEGHKLTDYMYHEQHGAIEAVEKLFYRVRLEKEILLNKK